MKHVFYTLLFVLLARVGHTQISGTLLDNTNNQPVAFANIGILGKGIGTVSDERGHFNLNVSAAHPNDTLVISMLGYRELSGRLRSFPTLYIKQGIVHLSPEPVELAEVEVVPRKFVYKTLGDKLSTKNVSLGFISNDLGSELGVPMHVKKNRRCFIDTLFFNINDCSYDSVLFRINLYTFRNGKPDSALLSKPLYVTSKIKFGTLRVDVTALNLESTGDFFVALEWLKDLGKGGLSFPAGLLKSHAFARDASQGKWEKAPLGVGFYCKTRIEKLK